ncbi:MAG: MarR family transcriptional regulator [Candidatus Omnitrophota bacterium]
MPEISLSEFADKLNQLMPAIIKEFARRQTNELYKGKITLPQFLILGFLERGGESRMTDIARFMGITTAASTGIVDRLVRAGYTVRSYDINDRRIIRMKLTQSGSILVKKVNKERRAMIIDIFGKISQAEREKYLEILTHIYSILTAHQTRA